MTKNKINIFCNSTFGNIIYVVSSFEKNLFAHIFQTRFLLDAEITNRRSFF